MVLKGYSSAILLLLITQECVVNTTFLDSKAAITSRKVNATTPNGLLQATNKIQATVSESQQAFPYSKEISLPQSQKEMKEEEKPVSRLGLGWLLLLAGCLLVLFCLLVYLMYNRNAIMDGVLSRCCKSSRIGRCVDTLNVLIGLIILSIIGYIGTDRSRN